MMFHNQKGNTKIKTKKRKVTNSVNNFKYLAGWMKSPEKDLEIRRAMAWAACYKMKRI